MGHRELKRVPLDFEFHIREVWGGYLNPWPGPTRCTMCDGTGYNGPTKALYDDYYNSTSPTGKGWIHDITQDEVQALINEDRLRDFTHVWDQENGWHPRTDGYVPTAAEVNEWSRHGLGHDTINCHILVEARAKRLGVYGKCMFCHGEGNLQHPDEAVRKAYEEWGPTEPPTGPGYQLWETTSEGSPVSPVFETAEALAEWCETNATIFAYEKTSKANWLKMFEWDTVAVGSMVLMRDGYMGR